MKLQVDHPESDSYTVADTKVTGYKNEDYSYISILITPRIFDYSKKENPIVLTMSKSGWIDFIAETATAFREAEK